MRAIKLSFEDQESSAISEIIYFGSTMKVVFRSGGAWLYEDVPANIFWEMANARSLGAAFHQQLRGRYQSRKVS